MQENKKVNIARKRRNDFPEFQVGYPERNDASNPDDVSIPDNEMERIHVDFETMSTSKKSAAAIIREIRETRENNVSQA